MGRPLTPEEIDALLAVPGQAVVSQAADAGAPARAYNFRRPDRVSKEQLHALHMLHERFGRNVSTSLSAYLRTLTEVTMETVDQRAYSEFLGSVPDPTAFYAIGVGSFDDPGALEISPSVAFAMVDRLLGGTGRTTPPDRALTEIEQHVLDAVVRLLLDSLSEAWRSVLDLTFEVRARDTRPPMLQIAGPNETVLMFAFAIKVGEAKGTLHLCLPASVVESTGTHFAQAWNRQRRKPTAAERAWVGEHLARVPMEVSARLHATVNAQDLLGLEPGDVLSLGIPAHKPIDVHVGDTLKFKGRLAIEAERVGLRIEARASAGAVMEF